MNIKVLRNVLEANDQVAAKIREQFRARRITAVNLISSPGAGKTSLLEKTIPALKPRYRIAVLPYGARELASLIWQSAVQVKAAVEALEKKTGVHPPTVEVNRLENAADAVHDESLRRLFEHAHLPAFSSQRNGRAEPANATADNDDRFIPHGVVPPVRVFILSTKLRDARRACNLALSCTDKNR